MLKIKKINWAYIIILLAVILRLEQLLINRSLNGDEAMLAINIIDRGFLSLLKPLGYHQVAPWGFLIAERLFVKIFGFSELPLRLFPFICSIISIFLFLKISMKMFEQKFVNISLLFFAVFSISIIYFSSEVKQYSTELMVGLLLLFLALRYRQNQSFLNIFLLGTAGVVSLWFSFSAVFVLGAIFVHTLFFKKNRTPFSVFALAVWLANFVIFYLSHSSIRASEKSFMQSYWGSGFITFPPKSWIDLRSLIEVPLSALDSFGGAYFSGFVIFLAILALIYLFSKDKSILVLLVTPIFLTLLASMFHIWPFRGRLVLFLAPFWIILFVKGIEILSNQIRTLKVFAVVCILLFIYPVFDLANYILSYRFESLGKPGKFSSSVYYDYSNRRNDMIKKAVSFIAKNSKDGDIVYYPHWPTGAQSLYYFKLYNTDLKNISLIAGPYKASRIDIHKKLSTLRGDKRAWTIITPVFEKRKIYEDFLNQNGKPILVREWDQAIVYFYDLSKKNKLKRVSNP